MGNLGCSVSHLGLERDKFDNKTVTFEEHIKEEHNMWHYLCFIVLVKVKDSTEYTGPESYVAEMIRVRRGPKARQPRQPRLCLPGSVFLAPVEEPHTKNLWTETSVLCAPLFPEVQLAPTLPACSQGGEAETWGKWTQGCLTTALSHLKLHLPA